MGSGPRGCGVALTVTVCRSDPHRRACAHVPRTACRMPHAGTIIAQGDKSASAVRGFAAMENVTLVSVEVRGGQLPPREGGREGREEKGYSEEAGGRPAACYTRAQREVHPGHPALQP